MSIVQNDKSWEKMERMTASARGSWGIFHCSRARTNKTRRFHIATEKKMYGEELVKHFSNTKIVISELPFVTCLP